MTQNALRELIGKEVQNDGVALEVLLRGELSFTGLRHTGNFVFEAQTPDGKMLVVHTQPVDEENEVIRITGITVTAN